MTDRLVSVNDASQLPAEVQAVLDARHSVTRSGATGARPTVSIIGTQFFDTTLNKPVWWNGTVWKDATGATV